GWPARNERSPQLTRGLWKLTPLRTAKRTAALSGLENASRFPQPPQPAPCQRHNQGPARGPGLRSPGGQVFLSSPIPSNGGVRAGALDRPQGAESAILTPSFDSARMRAERARPASQPSARRPRRPITPSPHSVGVYRCARARLRLALACWG